MTYHRTVLLRSAVLLILSVSGCASQYSGTETKQLRAEIEDIESTEKATTGYIEFSHDSAPIFKEMVDSNAPSNQTPETVTDLPPSVARTVDPITVTYEKRSGNSLGSPHRFWTFKVPFPAEFSAAIAKAADTKILPAVTRFQSDGVEAYAIRAERERDKNGKLVDPKTWNLELAVLSPANIDRIQISWIAVTSQN